MLADAFDDAVVGSSFDRVQHVEAFIEPEVLSLVAGVSLSGEFNGNEPVAEGSTGVENVRRGIDGRLTVTRHETGNHRIAF